MSTPKIISLLIWMVSPQTGVVVSSRREISKSKQNHNHNQDNLLIYLDTSPTHQIILFE
jgi:hypothetical protein